VVRRGDATNIAVSGLGRGVRYGWFELRLRQ
jgi:hypothetical protein